eukprot:2639259-Amphidinium_carterae.1
MPGPYSHSPCTLKPDLPRWCLLWGRKLPCLDQRQERFCSNAVWRSDAGSSFKGDPGDQTTIPLVNTTSTLLRTTEESNRNGVSQSRHRSGQDVAMSSSILPPAQGTRVKEHHPSAMHVTKWAAARLDWPNVCAARTGPATDTFSCRLAWTEYIRCALVTQVWRSGRTLTFRTCPTTGSGVTHRFSLSLDYRLQWVNTLPCQGYRQIGWIPTTYRVGEATMPGPSICSTNPGGWSNVEPVLDLGHDIVTVQETFVLRDRVSGAKYTADKLGYYSSFTPARKTDGRP